MPRLGCKHVLDIFDVLLDVFDVLLDVNHVLLQGTYISSQVRYDIYASESSLLSSQKQSNLSVQYSATAATVKNVARQPEMSSLCIFKLNHPAI